MTQARFSRRVQGASLFSFYSPSLTLVPDSLTISPTNSSRSPSCQHGSRSLNLHIASGSLKSCHFCLLGTFMALNRCSPDVIASISNRLSGQDLLRLWICGDSLLARLLRSNVTEISFTANFSSAKQPIPSLHLTQFPHLTSLSMVNDYSPSPNANLVLYSSAQLRNLSLEVPSSLRFIYDDACEGSFSSLRLPALAA